MLLEKFDLFLYCFGDKENMVLNNDCYKLQNPSVTADYRYYTGGASNPDVNYSFTANSTTNSNNFGNFNPPPVHHHTNVPNFYGPTTINDPTASSSLSTDFSDLQKIPDFVDLKEMQEKDIEEWGRYYSSTMKPIQESQQRHQQIPFPQVHQIPQAIPTNNGTNDSSDDDGDTKPVKPRSRKQTADHTIGKKPVTKRRRRSNLMKPGSQLYQFILQLLDDENKRDLIRWEERQRGIFRIMKKEQVAKMWGEARNRPMSYDSLSRGLRHYYHQGLLNAVNKKLHYQFTEKALEEWEVIRHKDSIEDR